MSTVGIDIGGRSHAVARCRTGETRADREVLRMSQDRAGFAALDDWLGRQPDPVTLVTMESSGHYWMPLASHLARQAIPVAVVNPLAARYFAKSRLGRTKSDPADARSLAEMGMRDAPVVRDPFAGVELRQAARFARTLVAEQARVCQRLHRLVELGFPELGEVFDDPTCLTARQVLRLAPTAEAARRRRTGTLADANRGPGHRRLGEARAERLRDLAAGSIAVPEPTTEVAFEVGMLLDQFDLLERQIETAEAHVAMLLDGAGPPAADHPGRRSRDLRGPHRRDRGHRQVRDVRPAARVCGGPSRRAQLRTQGDEPRDRLAHVQGGQRPSPCRGVPDRDGRDHPQPGHRRPLPTQA